MNERSEMNCLLRMVSDAGYQECDFEPEDEKCDRCGCWPQTIYANVDYWGETNSYKCANCVLIEHRENLEYAEKAWDEVKDFSPANTEDGHA